jgi:hypothetical protein
VVNRLEDEGKVALTEDGASGHFTNNKGASFTTH